MAVLRKVNQDLWSPALPATARTPFHPHGCLSVSRNSSLWGSSQGKATTLSASSGPSTLVGTP